LSSCVADATASAKAHFDPDLLGGVMVLEHPGFLARSSGGSSLYFATGEGSHQNETRITLKLIPYYAWANRSRTAMQVWVPYTHV
jgi:DUF1680 family protein